MKKKGFTLVELLVVIAILAILATVSIVGYTSFIGKAKESKCLQEATQIRDLIIAEDINNDNFSINGDSISFKVPPVATTDPVKTAEEVAKGYVFTNDLIADCNGLATGVTVSATGQVTYTDGEYTAIIHFNQEIKPVKTSSGS